jgi:hypothetical protein
MKPGGLSGGRRAQVASHRHAARVALAGEVRALDFVSLEVPAKDVNLFCRRNGIREIRTRVRPEFFDDLFAASDFRFSSTPPLVIGRLRETELLHGGFSETLLAQPTDNLLQQPCVER